MVEERIIDSRWCPTTRTLLGFVTKRMARMPVQDRLCKYNVLPMRPREENIKKAEHAKKLRQNQRIRAKAWKKVCEDASEQEAKGKKPLL